MGRIKLIRTDKNEYRVEGLDQETLESLANVLKSFVTTAKRKGYFGFRFDRFLDVISMRNVERMRISPDKSTTKSVDNEKKRYILRTRSEVRICIKELKDDYKFTRYMAADTLRKIGPDAITAIPALLKALKDNQPLVRGTAALALGEIGSDAAAVVPALLELLNDKDPGVSEGAVEALGMFGHDAITAVPALVNMLKDRDSKVRNTIAEALDKIGYEVAPP